MVAGVLKRNTGVNNNNNNNNQTMQTPGMANRSLGNKTALLSKDNGTSNQTAKDPPKIDANSENIGKSRTEEGNATIMLIKLDNSLKEKTTSDGPENNVTLENIVNHSQMNDKSQQLPRGTAMQDSTIAVNDKKNSTENNLESMSVNSKSANNSTQKMSSQRRM